MALKLKWLWLLISFLSAAGCNAPLKDERMLDLTPGETKVIIIEATKYKQKIKVAFDSPGAPVSVHLYLEKDKDAAETAIFNKKESDVILAAEKKVEQGKLEADIPANQAVIIRVHNDSNKDAKVTVKTTN
jgi:hypothetical protein